MKRYKALIISLILFLLFIFGLNRVSKKDQNARMEARLFMDKYPRLSKNDTTMNINGIVSKAELSLNLYYKGSFMIELSNSTCFSLYGATRNYLYNIPDLMDFINLNDSISKSSESDSIFVYRNNQEYYFILGKIINKKE